MAKNMVIEFERNKVLNETIERLYKEIVPNIIEKGFNSKKVWVPILVSASVPIVVKSGELIGNYIKEQWIEHWERKKMNEFQFTKCFPEDSQDYKNISTYIIQFTKSRINIIGGLIVNLPLQEFEFEEEKMACEIITKGTMKHVQIYSNDINIIKKFTDSFKVKKIDYVYFSNGEWSTKHLNVNKTFDNIFLTKVYKDKLIDSIDNFEKSKDLYTHRGIPYKKGYMFHGKAGCGKTSTVLAVSQKTHREVYFMKISSMTSDEHLLELISEIKNHSILVIEDIDEESKYMASDDELILLKTSKLQTELSELTKKPVENPVCKKTVKYRTFLDIFDGYYGLDDIILIMTTNNLETVDKTLIRAGRIDEKYEFDFAKKDQIYDIFKKYYDIEISTDNLREDMSVGEVINEHVLPNMHNHVAALDGVVKK